MRVLSDDTLLSVTVDTATEPNILFHWPTRFSARELLEHCIPYVQKGRFTGDVQVVIFDDNLSDGRRILGYYEYLNGDPDLDGNAHAVRFNATTDGAPFSVMWSRPTVTAPDLKGEVDAIFGHTPQNMMLEMVKTSATPLVTDQLAKQLIDAGRKLEQAA